MNPPKPYFHKRPKETDFAGRFPGRISANTAASNDLNAEGVDESLGLDFR